MIIQNEATWMWRLWRFWFIVRCMINGLTLNEARYAWTLLCMDQATYDATGKGMGTYRVPLRDQTLSNHGRNWDRQ